MRSPTCWVLTTGEPGMRSQVLGLAERLGLVFEEKIVSLKKPWKWLPGNFSPFLLKGLTLDSSSIKAPWPDILITCGRRSAAVSMAIKKASKGKIFTVHIQNPLVSPKYFDLVASPEHDNFFGENVIQTIGALHRISNEKLLEAKSQWHEYFSSFRKPLVCILIGGDSSAFSMTDANTVLLSSGISKLVANGFGVFMTFSSRTPSSARKHLTNELIPLGVKIWDGKNENPYIGMLAIADYLVVTSDSASMVSEATASGKPVYVFHLEGGSKKFDRFHNQLEKIGMTRPFKGKLDYWEYSKIDETGRLAELIMQKYHAHLG